MWGGGCVEFEGAPSRVSVGESLERRNEPSSFLLPQERGAGISLCPTQAKRRNLCPLAPRHPPVPGLPELRTPPPTAPHWSEAPASWGCARMPAFQPPLKISLPPIHRQLPPPCPRRIPFQLVHPGRAAQRGLLVPASSLTPGLQVLRASLITAQGGLQDKRGSSGCNSTKGHQGLLSSNPATDVL